MTEFSERLLNEAARKRRMASHFRPVFIVVIPLLAVLFRVYVPLFFPYLTYLELPLLIVVYFSLMGRQPVTGTFFGAGVGLLQDCLSDSLIGMYGIVKTLVGYFAATVSLRFDVENPFIRLILSFFFFYFHQFFFWVLVRALLGRNVDFDLNQTMLSGLLNAAVALPLFFVLDKLKE